MALALEHRLTERVANALTRGAYGRTERTLEALQNVEALLALEDRGWGRMNPTTGRDANDLITETRAELVRRSRKYYLFDPMCKQAIRLFTSYAIGRGLSIQAMQDETIAPTNPESPTSIEDPTGAPETGPGSAAALQQEADTFWEHPANDVVFSVRGQHENADKLNIDGEIFFVLFPGDDVTRVRVLKDCLEVVDVITNPEDYSEVWYYVRRSTDIFGTTTTRLYADIGLHERTLDDGEGLPEITPALRRAYHLSETATIATMQDEATGTDTGYPFVMHIALNTVGVRGYPLLTPAMDWAKVQRKFLEDRATISAAHARFAWKRTINGPAAMLGNLPQGAQGGVATGPFSPGQVYPGMAYPAAGTLSTNKGADWEPVNAQSGGQNAYVECRNFTLQFCRAVGIPEHYFADGSMGTRATSSSMEKPVELLFTDYQNVWKAIYAKLFSFALRVAGHPWNAHAVRVDAPKILEESVSATVDAITKVLGVLPEFDIEEMRLVMLSAFALDNPQDLLAKIQARRRAMDEQEIAVAKAQANFDPAEQEPNESDPATTSAKVIDFHKRKATFLQTLVKNTTKSPQFGPGEPGSPLSIRKPTPKQTKIASPRGGGAR